MYDNVCLKYELKVFQRRREYEMRFQTAASSSSVADVARPGHAVDAEWTGDGKFSQSVSQISCR